MLMIMTAVRNDDADGNDGDVGDGGAKNCALPFSVRGTGEETVWAFVSAFLVWREVGGGSHFRPFFQRIENVESQRHWLTLM